MTNSSSSSPDPLVLLHQAHVQAQRLADNLRADIKNAATRAEHIRLTRHAIEAQQLADAIRTEYVETDV